MSEDIAFDSHKRYTWVEREDAATGRAVHHRLRHAPGALRRYLQPCRPGTRVGVEATVNCISGCGSARDIPKRSGRWPGTWPQPPSTSGSGKSRSGIPLWAEVEPTRCKRDGVMSLRLAE